MSVFETSFRGKTILVTGAGRGIGRAVSVELYKCGAKIYALSKNPDNLASLNAECPGIIPISVDLADWEATRAAVSAIQEPVECLVNNAAIAYFTPFLNIKGEDFDSVMNVNLKAVVNVSQAVVEKLIAAGKPGSIVNVSSLAGRKALPVLGIYCMSKAGLEMLTKVMAIELGQYKIRVNSVNPAGVDTDMCKDMTQGLTPADLEKMSAAMTQKPPLGLQMMPMDQVVNTILFMLSDLGGQITGESLAIDGGYLIA